MTKETRHFLPASVREKLLENPWTMRIILIGIGFIPGMFTGMLLYAIHIHPRVH